MLMNLQFFAHKKGGGSTANGRDSRSKRLGAKSADGQLVKGRFNHLPSTRYTYLPRCKRRYGVVTIHYFAKVEGVVRFERKGRDKRQVSVYPVAD